MMRCLRFTVRVRQQAEALDFYLDKLGFEKRMDLPLGPNRRWITIAPKDERAIELVLQPADWFSGEEYRQHLELVGKEPAMVFQVDDCQATYEQLAARGVEFYQPPAQRPYGLEANAHDLYGNTLVFLQLAPTR